VKFLRATRPLRTIAALQHFWSLLGQSGHVERLLAKVRRQKAELLRSLFRSALTELRVTGKTIAR
jgi:hypothetical protein